ncbi:type II toxin-antitoxin system PemK/MazF family toxin [Pararhizobium sp. PWRC1-1]|uniref:type II toxin-antitoxin system PemK/MazF family toxin n=1 Tax=Pararhizobium sp. PWRC1-1 TaxID=2804566 RepID=UPI003CE979ED
MAAALDPTIGLILLEQSRALDRKRLVKRLSSIPAAVLRQTLRMLRELYDG